MDLNPGTLCTTKLDKLLITININACHRHSPAKALSVPSLGMGSSVGKVAGVTSLPANSGENSRMPVPHSSSDESIDAGIIFSCCSPPPPLLFLGFLTFLLFPSEVPLSELLRSDKQWYYWHTCQMQMSILNIHLKKQGGKGREEGGRGHVEGMIGKCGKKTSHAKLFTKLVKKVIKSGRKC